jgi:superfamily I DNA and/or RNA helicase
LGLNIFYELLKAFQPILFYFFNDAFNIPPLYSPTTSSAQQLADNANNFGSYYEVQNKKVWVGMPLVVHRRCLAPMFTISNKISYNEKMVSDTNYNDELINQLPDSCWIDVVSSEQDFNINSSIKEIKIMNEFIDKYKHLLNNNYYIISPFKSINSMFINNNDEKDTKKIHGTVHTFQGKEADVVFIILGGKKEGSKAWAAQKANILNVALTRAKKKVYIIGDYNKWKNLNYFNTATDILKRYKFN